MFVMCGVGAAFASEIAVTACSGGVGEMSERLKLDRVDAQIEAQTRLAAPCLQSPTVRRCNLPADGKAQPGTEIAPMRAPPEARK